MSERWLEELGSVAFEPSCVVEDDPGEVVRHAAPATERDQVQMREQAIARMRYDPTAVLARERRIAIADNRHKVRELKRWAR